MYIKNSSKLSDPKSLCKKINVNRVLCAVCLLLISYSCRTDDTTIRETVQKNANEYPAAVVVDWFDLIKSLTIQTAGYTPPVAARAFGYTGIALYEGVVMGMPDNNSLSGQLSDLEINIVLDSTQVYHWPTVANNILAKMTRHFYANTTEERLLAISSLEEKYRDRFLKENGEKVYEASVRLAEEVGNRILQWSATDGGQDAQFNNFPQDYRPPAGQQFWVPTAPAYQLALQPYWGLNRPFLISNIEGNQPVNPPPFSVDETSLCYQRALEVYNVVTNITPEQKKIAEFWSDDPITTATPPGHSISILNQLIKEKNLSLDQSVEAFAKIGIGLSDAFISCWKTKYETVYIRPITYINKYIDPDWSPILNTPPFPEYTSGHSVQSGALAEILTSLFGENHEFTDHTHENRTDMDGTPRTFTSFYQLAEEAALSRLYGGIHFHEAISLGLEQGYQIGRNVNALDWDN